MFRFVSLFFVLVAVLVTSIAIVVYRTPYLRCQNSTAPITVQSGVEMQCTQPASLWQRNIHN
ncbi:hypothetical protein [Vibrio sp. SCSIO 43136]|uniref:hypothetical protein n=1 Tax=Vibrio sp. SCSIO 43136 TaxID=2819101 RepID=UPI00207548F4|nr:hypothetical protein [Vibrio sp. SCSIO 43136]USD67856.1 hypothetical protein J4N39_16865 [Vibrio sp. SCSIO 43136]